MGHKHKKFEHESDCYIDDVDEVIPTTEARCVSPSDAHALKVDGAGVLDSDDAYDEERLRLLDKREVEDLLDFETEFKATIGATWVDEEVRRPVEAAFKLALELLEDGNVTPLGLVAMVLKALLKGHPRGFGRYYTGGPDPWPRPSAVVKAELDAEMPFALEWLRTELQESLEKEREQPVDLTANTDPETAKEKFSR
jgi:hypothetical protein